ncbi:MAG TPA: phage minor head protein [Thermotogota bacterium]|nr:phage minor head protein [Thermotogota bacterium]
MSIAMPPHESTAQAFARQLIALQLQYIDSLEMLLSSRRTMYPKTMETKLRKAREMLAEQVKDFRGKYSEVMIEVYEKTISGVIKNELKTTINWNAISQRELDRLKQAGLAFMDNYQDDMIKKIKSQLYVSFLNGESYLDAYNRIKPIGNDQSRPKMMIRDQMERVYQSAIVEAYGSTGDPDEYVYNWVGPDDERTTEICDERKRGNPYTWEEVKSMDSHPHIQCRHRWQAVPK